MEDRKMGMLESFLESRRVKREITALGELTLDVFGNIKCELEGLKDVVNNEKELNLNYDGIKQRLSLLKFWLNSNTKFRGCSLTKDKMLECYNEINSIEKTISECGMKIKREVITQIEGIDINNYYDEKYSVSIDEIMRVLEWIWDRLELDELNHPGRTDITGMFLFGREDIKGKISFCGLTYRQIKSYEKCLESIERKSRGGVVHYLYEFVDNYQNG